MGVGGALARPPPPSCPSAKSAKTACYVLYEFPRPARTGDKMRSKHPNLPKPRATFYTNSPDLPKRARKAPKIITSERKNRQVPERVCVWMTYFRVAINLARAPYHPRPIGVGPHPHPNTPRTACEAETPTSGCGGGLASRCSGAGRRRRTDSSCQTLQNRVPPNLRISPTCPN